MNVIYLYYGNQIESKKIPIIYSISSLRKFNKDCQIYVIDISDKNNDWSEWQEKLQFRVIFKKAKIYDFFTSDQLSQLPASIICTKYLDVLSFTKNLNEDICVYCDCDVIWIKNPYPLEKEGNYLASNGNSGFWYYNNKSVKVKDYYEYYLFILTKCIENPIFFKEISLYHPVEWFRKTLSEEIINYYIVNKSQLIQKLDINEHITPWIIKNKSKFLNIDKIKMIHLVGLNKIEAIDYFFENFEIMENKVINAIREKNNIFNT